MGRWQGRAQLWPLKELSLERPHTPASIPAILCFAGCGSAGNLGAPEAQAQARPGTLGIALPLCPPLAWRKGNAVSLQGHFLENLEHRAHKVG